jgi:Tfp pilus assembly protein PilF
LTGRGGPKTRLETWKEVAAFLGKDERTAKRWEAERGLPIHRLPGEHRSRIYAETAELEAWLRGEPLGRSEPEPAPETQPIPPAPRRPFWRRPAVRAGLAVGALLALVAGGVVLVAPMLRRLHEPPVEAQKHYVAAEDYFAQRRPDTLLKAIDEYNAAIARDPDYAQAYAGLAKTYDIISEFTKMPPSQAFPLARSAAREAIARNDQIAEAHAALAFAEYWGFWRPDEARREFAKAVALNTRLPLVRHWYATFLSVIGDRAAALREIEAARRLDPDSDPIAADRDLILLVDGRRDEAVAHLNAMIARRPDFLSPYRYLADDAFCRGDLDAYLVQVRRMAQLTGDLASLDAANAAEAAKAAGGRAAVLATLIARQEQLYTNGQASAYSVAQLQGLAGQPDRAWSLLRQSFDRREEEAHSFPNDCAFQAYRQTPAFKALLARMRALGGD